MELVGVIGGGTMGAGIAEVCAKAGSSVLVLETKEEFAAADYAYEFHNSPQKLGASPCAPFR